MSLKFTSWNLDWADTLVAGTTLPKKYAVPHPERKNLIFQTLREIDPDIFCMVEGPRGEQRAKTFGEDVLQGEWVPVFLGDGTGAKDKQYETSGWQWIWFYVKPEIADRCRLQDVSVWVDRTGPLKWKIHPWGEPCLTKDLYHYRHPQVLIYTFEDGSAMEMIGVHLKSLRPDTPFSRDDDGNISFYYLQEALTNRIKIATEARNVRAYISQRFADSAGTDPAIIIGGDCNDGEGQDYFEENYLFFSVVSNLEGSILKSPEFFYHALFDYDPSRSWSVMFKDEVTGKPADENRLLIDHILYSQPLRNGPYPVHARPNAGLVEHDAWEKFSTGAPFPASDHRPVSITLT